MFPPFNDIPKFNQKLAQSILTQNYQAIQIYTDASQSNNGTGFAYYILNSNESYQARLNDECSIFTAEAFAIYAALWWAMDNATRDICIWSDSRSVLSALAGNDPKNRLLWDIKEQTRILRNRDIKVSFVWVKAHCGIPNNETVDQLARQAYSSPNKFRLFLPNDCLNIFRKRAALKWESEYIQYASTSSNHYFLIHPRPPKRVSYMHSDYISRKFTSTIVRLKTNHGCFPSHLYKIKLENTSFCSCDDASVGDLNHIIFSCPLHQQPRKKLVAFLLATGCPFPTDLVSLLFTERLDVYKALYSYLAEAKVIL